MWIETNCEDAWKFGSAGEVGGVPEGSLCRSELCMR